MCVSGVDVRLATKSKAAKVNTTFLVSHDVGFKQFFRQNLMELVEKNRKIKHDDDFGFFCVFASILVCVVMCVMDICGVDHHQYGIF